MKPVFQTKQHNPPKVYGNCYAACYASILEIPIEDVPPFEELPGFNEGDQGTWVKVLNAWLKAKGFVPSQHNVPETIKHRHAPSGYAIGTFKSPRHPGVLHSAVFLNGTRVHDPAGENVPEAGEIVDWLKLLPIIDADCGVALVEREKE